MRPQTGFIAVFAAVLTITVIAPGAAGAALVDEQLEAYLALQLPGTTAPAVVTYHRSPGTADLERLETLGIDRGFLLRELPMVIVDVNAVQLAALAEEPGVASIWGNEVMRPLTNESREFIGVPQMMADSEVTAQNSANPGFPISGLGIGIGYIDTGIDATHPDLEAGLKVRQNVNQPLAYGVVSDGGLLLGVGVSISDLLADTGFVPPIFVEDQPTTDLESGHGTHGAAISAGLGVASGDFYGGVAPGAHLVGINAGDDMGLPLVAILGAFDYLLVNQIEYNVRVINNSWGTRLRDSALSPDNPINVATREAHDRNMVVVFAAGNAGTATNAINPYSTMAWTISVAAGQKNGLGSPTSFSSRGVDDGTGSDTAGMPADPNTEPNLRPDVAAPGERIISARAAAPAPILNAISVLNGDAQAIPPAFLARYYSSNGTSFAAPHVSGVVALMLEADPLLTPDEVVTILRATANPMPFPERVVGAGYVDAHNAVRAALDLDPVPHPADLFPGPDTPEIIDARSDQIGTAAQDILTGDFDYDSEAEQLVYTLTLTDLEVTAPNERWTMSSAFGDTTIFVTAAITETGEHDFRYGRITILEGGIRNQETLGAADSGAIDAASDTVTVRLGIAKVDEAVGFSVLGTTSTSTAATAQILIGTSVTGGLLLNADSASGSDFEVEGDSDDNGDDPPPPCEGEFTERFAGALTDTEESVEISFTLQCSSLDALMTYHPGNQSPALELLDDQGQVVAFADEANGRRMHLDGLEPGDYAYRVSGPVSRSIDFVIRSRQQ